ncbi:SWI/SNF-related matrix-associated actin-dependent regulator of chromatin subfamily A-like protein 1 [Drosophila ficusphila]|uniref:SWI/SNF-related matrix-associated actin-dependent regulator of chromatin subfamily A-like protein 1 n=1 Tax=Drosophila ficusphila TaxID=30025 RepID=UPI0007E78210|nr:SWI/SNF-related matrix-associated actin-dependent regulator of chromatin subfamily A-like protein 1 [Drosophila ficusphila]
MSSCSSSEIAEKKRIALAKLQAKKSQLLASSTSGKLTTNPTNAQQQVGNRNGNPNQPQAKSPLNFYKSPPAAQEKISKVFASTSNDNKSSSFLNALKAIKQTSTRELSRGGAHPYQRPNGGSPRNKPTLSLAPEKEKPATVMLGNSITCNLFMTSTQRFAAQTSGYHEKLIAVFKNMPTKTYDGQTRIWSFDLSDYQSLQTHAADLKPYVHMVGIPKKVISLCQQPPVVLERSVLASIEPKLADQLMPFQQDGVCFSIAQKGRIMICDEMGLGKTYQSLAVADYFKDDWPLLICTTASTRDTWAKHIVELLPKVPVHYVQVLNNNQQYVGEAQVLITSYNMMERHMEKLLQRKYGFIIFDESHTLKNSKAKCTSVAKRLTDQAKRVVLLSGTPALSRPLELFTQLQMVDTKFMNFMEFTTRYCDGKQSTFGWDATGQSNLEELKVILTLKYMLRRTKTEVLPQLAEKNRETVVLDPALVWTNDETKETLETFNKELKTCKGKAMEEILIRFYARTAEVKAKAVCAYLKTLVKEQKKFIIFAHHRVMMDAISDCLSELKVHYIRIDGQTRSDLRSDFVDTFQKKSSCKVAVLSLKACNAGITLTAAEIIVFAELDWNPSTLAQAESRAHRIGQTKPVICRYLMAHKTADDTIWNMLKNKQEVLSKVGIFAENLQKATHTTAPTSSHKIEEFFSPAKPASSNPQRGSIIQYLSPAPQKTSREQNNNNTKNANENKVESDIAAFFNDEDDEALLDLDI